MKFITGICIAFVTITVAVSFLFRDAFSHPLIASSPNETTSPSPFLLKCRQKATEAHSFVKKKGFNADVCFLADMSLESGGPRFFVFDLKKDSILSSGLVTHGRCNENWLTGRKYGNEVGCGCTSLGRYKIGTRYTGRFGTAYKLHGLDSSNSNAYKRYVVLHSHACVPEASCVPDPICQSDGCPTVSPGFLKQLQSILDGSGKPVLLWIYE